MPELLRPVPAARPPAPRTPAPPSEAAFCTRLLLAWLVLRTALWVAVAAASYHAPPLDLVEWLSWGGSWGWGYPKHPPLPAWVADAFARLSPGDVWGVYLAGYLTAAATVGAAYVLGREYLSPRLALAAALALDGLKYLTNDPAEFSNNVMLDAGWAWAAVCLHRAVVRGTLRWWLATGVVVGLTLLCKYTVGVLLVAVGGFVLWDPTARRCLRAAGPYLAALAAAAVFAPHAAWLARNDFLTLKYAAERSADLDGWLTHLTNPLGFVVTQAVWLLPVAFVLWPLVRTRSAAAVVWSATVSRWRRIVPDAVGGRFSTLPPEGERVESAGHGRSATDRRFLHAVVLGPVALLLVLSLATGCQLREIWASPLWTFAGVWALVTFRGAAEPDRVRAFVRRWAVVAVAMPLVMAAKQLAGPYLDGAAGRSHYPGKELAAEVNRRWAGRFGGDVPVVAGEGWRAGLVCSYLPHRPKLYSSGSMGYLVLRPEHCPWTSDAEFNARGGVLLWDADQLAFDVPGLFRERFPRIEAAAPIELPHRTAVPVPPTRVGVAFVPPADRHPPDPPRRYSSNHRPGQTHEPSANLRPRGVPGGAGDQRPAPDGSVD